ncbi:hypothetical protein JCM8097_004860 [Rhodosporidiobolus ruineniae]
MDFQTSLPGRFSSASPPTKLPRPSRSGTVSAPLPRPLEPVSLNNSSSAGEAGTSTPTNGFESGAYVQERSTSRTGEPVSSPFDGRRSSPESFASRASSPAYEHRRSDEQRRDAYQALAMRQLGGEGRLGSVQAGGGRKRPKKWLVHVIPPDVLPHSPPPLPTSGFASGYGASGRYSGGILLPLQPTLSAQVSLIAREFSLPSIAGVALYLCLPGHPPPPTYPAIDGQHGYFPPTVTPPPQDSSGFKPRLTSESWSAIWDEHLDPEGQAQGMAGMGGLPIAGRIEFDIDTRRARWLQDWLALPPATLDSVSLAPQSPAIEVGSASRNRFGGSLPYNRPFTPNSASEAHLSELATTDEEGEVVTDEADATAQYPVKQRDVSPDPPQIHNSTILRQPSSRNGSLSQSPGSGSPARYASWRDESLSSTPSLSSLSTPIAKHVLPNDSGFGEPASKENSFRAVHESVLDFAPEQHPSLPPLDEKSDEESITVSDSGQQFTFPRPTPRQVPPRPPTPADPLSRSTSSAGSLQLGTSIEDWTAQLDRLHRVSETALVEGVEHPSAFGSFDATASFGALYADIVGEVDEGPHENEEQDKPAYEGDFASGLYPPHGLYGQKQPQVLLPASHGLRLSFSVTSTARAATPSGRFGPPSPVLSPSAPSYPYNLACLYPSPQPFFFRLLKLVPTVPIPPRFAFNLSPVLSTAYPILQLYRPVYPYNVPYPSLPSGYASAPLAARRSPRPPPLPLPREKDGLAYHAVLDSWPPTPPSPERQPSPSLMDRLRHSCDDAVVDGEAFERDFEHAWEENAKAAAAVRTDAEAPAYEKRERAGGLVERDWGAMRGMRSLREVSELSPEPEDPVEQATTEAYAEAGEESVVDRDAREVGDAGEQHLGPSPPFDLDEVAVAALAPSHAEPESPPLVEDDPFKPFGSSWPDEEDDDEVDEDDEDDFLASYGVGRPLSSIVEESESETTAATLPLAGPFGERGFFGDLAGGSEEDERDYQHELDVSTPVDSPMLAVPSYFGEPPQIVYSAATASPSPSSSRYSPSPPHSPEHPGNSPLPSPTITPARPSREYEEALPARPSNPTPPPALDLRPLPPVSAIPVEEDDYTLEIDDTTTSLGHAAGYDDQPYIASPGLQHALGLDSPPDFQPVRFADDDEFESDGSHSEDGSQYAVHDLAADESCQTYDHLSPLPPPLPPKPVLFTFPSTQESPDFVDALAQFCCEAQMQSIERRGKFVIALSGYEPLPELLSQALVEDERVEWDKWHVFFTEDTVTAYDHPASTCAAYSAFFRRVPIPSEQVHVVKTDRLDPERREICPHVAREVADDVEEELARTFGADAADGTPRFDLVLLGIGEDGSCASLLPSHPLLDEHEVLLAPVVGAAHSPTARLTFTLPLLCAARRLAFVVTGSSKRAALANILDERIAVEDEEKVPAGRVVLATGQPVIVFADEGAVEGVNYPSLRFWDGEEEEGEKEAEVQGAVGLST